MVQTPERKASGFKQDVDSKNPEQVPLAMVDALLRYRPVDSARGLETPLMVVAVEEDATTPLHHATAIYDAAVGPQKLLVQRNTGHYTAYQKYAAEVIPVIVDWFTTHVRAAEDIVAIEGERRA